MTTTTQYISVRETAQILTITEKKVMDLIEERKLQAYRIADKFLRLKKSEVLSLRNSGNVVSDNKIFPYTKAEKFQDFLYYNDFYIFAILSIIILLYIIFFT